MPSQLNFIDEDKLIEYIKNNIKYDFDIRITSDASGIKITDASMSRFYSDDELFISLGDQVE